MTTMHRTLWLPFALTACMGGQPSQTTPDAPAAPDVSLTTAGGLGERLVDGQGNTLYFFANDVAGVAASAYAGSAWPPFNVTLPTLGDGLEATDFDQFERSDGSYQATWKGRPLYYYAADTAANPTAGEALGECWFVARAYNLFFAAATAVAPQGGAADAPFLTNGAGRTLYVFQKDTRGTTANVPKSDCSGTCAETWPVWSAPASLASLALPSTIQPADLTSFTNGVADQFVYQGWPLYFYATDTAPGDVAGAKVANWYTATAAWNGTMP